MTVDNATTPTIVAGRTEIEVAADTVAVLIAAGFLRTALISAAAEAVGLRVGDVQAALERRRRQGNATPLPIPALAEPSVLWCPHVEIGDDSICAAPFDTADELDRHLRITHRLVHQTQDRADMIEDAIEQRDQRMASQTVGAGRQPAPAAGDAGVAVAAPPRPAPTTHPNAGRIPANKKPEGETRVCIKCEEEKPIGEFLPRTDSNSRRTECDDCRKQISRDRYLTVEERDKVGIILGFILEHGDPLVGHACTHCQRTLVEGDQVEVGDITDLIHHHQCPQGDTP